MKTQSTPKDKTSALFDKVFADSPKWNHWYFSKVYRQEDSMEILDKDNSQPVASLQLMGFRQRFHGADVPIGYVFGAMTSPQKRGEGLMSRLMVEALEACRGRGDLLCALIPAERHLYFFYDKFGFATVYYMDEERYTSLHSFEIPSNYVECEPDYDGFSRLERDGKQDVVLHSRERYGHMLEDLRMDGGDMVGVSDREGRLAAVAAYIHKGDRLAVRYLLAADETAKEAVLGLVKNRFPHSGMVVEAAPGERVVNLRSRGMARVVNPHKALGVMAQAHPSLKAVIKIKDDLLPVNTGIYRINGGNVYMLDEVEAKLTRPTLEVSVKTLTSIMFSLPKIGEIFDLPTSRPFMAMMYD